MTTIFYELPSTTSSMWKTWEPKNRKKIATLIGIIITQIKYIVFYQWNYRRISSMDLVNLMIKLCPKNCSSMKNWRKNLRMILMIMDKIRLNRLAFLTITVSIRRAKSFNTFVRKIKKISFSLSLLIYCWK